jgi:hypothetical protein
VAEDWSPEEVAATVADYFAMLEHELRGEPYNKREHNRQLQARLNNRSAPAIEFKHANISAVLIDLGYPYIDGYKPRSNYQQLLFDEVAARLDLDIALVRAADDAVQVPMPAIPKLVALRDVIVPPPTRDRDRSYERRVAKPAMPRIGVNYLEREARNRSLGAAGEAFAMQVEHRRLWESGHRHLADKIEHVSQTKGDGLGYDILSFEASGRERLIEVKTTAFGAMTPFFASSAEVRVSEEHSDRFHLYRLHKFRESPKLFVLDGALSAVCTLDATQYRASVL